MIVPDAVLHGVLLGLLVLLYGKLVLIHRDVRKTLRKGGEIMATNQDILDEVTAQSTIEDSILALVQQLVSENDPAARQAILDALKANRGKLEAAVLAGTPQAPQP